MRGTKHFLLFCKQSVTYRHIVLHDDCPTGYTARIGIYDLAVRYWFRVIFEVELFNGR